MSVKLTKKRFQLQLKLMVKKFVGNRNPLHWNQYIENASPWISYQLYTPYSGTICNLNSSLLTWNFVFSRPSRYKVELTVSVLYFLPYLKLNGIDASCFKKNNISDMNWYFDRCVFYFILYTMFILLLFCFVHYDTCSLLFFIDISYVFMCINHHLFG